VALVTPQTQTGIPARILAFFLASHLVRPFGKSFQPQPATRRPLRTSRSCTLLPRWVAQCFQHLAHSCALLNAHCEPVTVLFTSSSALLSPQGGGYARAAALLRSFARLKPRGAPDPWVRTSLALHLAADLFPRQPPASAGPDAAPPCVVTPDALLPSVAVAAPARCEVCSHSS
jgi:hypothetical protein